MENPQKVAVFFSTEGVQKAIFTVVKLFLGYLPQTVVIKGGRWEFFRSLGSTSPQIGAASENVKKGRFLAKIQKFSQKHTPIHQKNTHLILGTKQ
jgi:hypothetical protein